MTGPRLAGAYRRGAAFEKKVALYLRDDGYFVIESRGSHGCADLAAIKRGQTLLIQCKGVKVLDSATGLADEWWNLLYHSARAVGGVPILADRPKLGIIRLRRLVAEHVLHSGDWPMVPFETDEVVTSRGR